MPSPAHLCDGCSNPAVRQYRGLLLCVPCWDTQVAHAMRFPR